MRVALFVTISVLTFNANADAYQNQTYQNQTKIRQLEVDQRSNQIRQDMRAESNVLLNSSGKTHQPTFGPTLPGYSASPRLLSGDSINPSKVEAYLKGLGSPEDGTGIYAYPAEERLYQYGLMCIETGFVSEGVRAITEHLRIQAENN